MPAYALLSTLQRSHQANRRALSGSGAPSDAGQSRRFGRFQHPGSSTSSSRKCPPPTRTCAIARTAWSKSRPGRGRAHKASLLPQLFLALACPTLSGGATEPLSLPLEAMVPSAGCPKVAHFAAFDHQAPTRGRAPPRRPRRAASGWGCTLKTAILGGLQLATTAFSEGDTGLRAALHTPEEQPSHRARSQRLRCPL